MITLSMFIFEKKMLTFLLSLWVVSPSQAIDPIAYRFQNIGYEVWDTSSDDSFQKFIDKSHPFLDQGYVPQDLEPINSDFTSNKARKYQLRKEAWDAFADMAWHFWDDSWRKKRLTINTAYRSYSYQKHLIETYCKNKTAQCAEAWASEHQAGLALDLWVNNKSIDQQSFEWLQANAYKRGFHNTYQKGVEIDGQTIEKRHRRYLWKELAKELYEKEMSLAEWYYGLKWDLYN